MNGNLGYDLDIKLLKVQFNEHSQTWGRRIDVIALSPLAINSIRGDNLMKLKISQTGLLSRWLEDSASRRNWYGTFRCLDGGGLTYKRDLFAVIWQDPEHGKPETNVVLTKRKQLLTAQRAPVVHVAANPRGH